MVRVVTDATLETVVVVLAACLGLEVGIAARNHGRVRLKAWTSVAGAIGDIDIRCFGHVARMAR